MTPRIASQNVVQAVDRYIDKELADAAKYENSEPLDSSGCWSLHRLAAEIYAMGWDDGERAEHERENAQRQRDRESKP